MVKILLKKGNETQFLYETSVGTDNEELTKEITYIYNGRLKVSRICSDEWGERCEPSGGSTFNKDPMGRRNGKQPKENMQELIKNSLADVKEMLSKVIDIASAQLWFSGKELLRNKKLCNFVGNNEKTKIVVKISKMGEGAPAREPVVSEEERRQMMLHAYRRQEELKRRGAAKRRAADVISV
ncbi:hypothetical protein LSTR_LSTR012832 [Laodelphax striatellus]|uniref:Uncharacterized protein n=1 Tax=Laodelphax striatellus TaxID=195883 RepID=A0A482XCY0_LAOST|nr:hypothetical protein LSTR_LSTR012832 [Laodelphax striatellus]